MSGKQLTIWLLLFLLIAGSLIVILFFWRRSRPPASSSITTTNDYIPPIWGNNQIISNCRGYQFPPLNAYTPALPRYQTTNLATLNYVDGGFSCLWYDQINAQQIQQTCLQGNCTDQAGNIYAVGDTRVVYGPCNTDARCAGKLTLLGMGNGTPTISCITSTNDTPVVQTSTCSLEDANQIMILNTSQNYLASIVQRSSGYCLLGSSQAVSFGPCASIPSTQSVYQWLLIPSMTYLSDQVQWSAPAQIGYLGKLPTEVIQDNSNYQSEAALRSFIVAANIQTLTRLTDGSLALRPWLTTPIDQEDDSSGLLITPFTPLSPQLGTLLSLNQINNLGAALAQL